MTKGTEDRGIYDEASTQRWNARCGMWVPLYVESLQRQWAAEDAAEAECATQEALLDEMAKAGLDSRDQDQVMWLSQRAGKTLTYAELKAQAALEEQTA